NRTPQSVARFGIEVPEPSIAPPEIGGQARLGGKAHCKKGDWARWAGDKPSSTRYAFDGFQWNLGGVPITGQTGKEYGPKGADVGHALTCTETVPYTLFPVTAPATSAAVTVEGG